MPKLTGVPPHSHVELVTEFHHGFRVEDPYRWLEDQSSIRTRAWIDEQTLYARAFLDDLPTRTCIRERMREFLAVETYDSFKKAGERYIFRKRLPNQEQPSIYLREGPDGADQLLVDPLERGTGKYTTVRPIQVSPDGRMLLYEVKQGGERTGTFELLEIETRMRIPDFLPRGYLRGFAFAPDGKSFFYTHEAVDAKRPFYRAAYRHSLGVLPEEDQEVFSAGEDDKIRLGLASDSKQFAVFVHKFHEQRRTDVYLQPFGRDSKLEQIFHDIDYSLGLRLLDNKILAITDRDAANRRIVEICLGPNGQQHWSDIIPESDTPIGGWLVTANHIFVSYVKYRNQSICVFDLAGHKLGELVAREDQTIRMMSGSAENDEVVLESESFTEPAALFRYSVKTNTRTSWATRSNPLDPADFSHSQVWVTSKDGTRVPLSLVGRSDVLHESGSPTVMTAYGGYGVSATPQFSVLVAFLMEHGCLFAVPSIRGGSEFGIEWHNAAKRHNRQRAYDDFLAAAEWLIESGRTAQGRLAIFGGSNSGLLVGAALTQRPDLFRAVVCMVPILDMLRYHLFDNAHLWKEEFGTAENPDDFHALAEYSPYHRVRDGVAYPATMIVSGDSDGNCNPLHARKMTARLQTANASKSPIFLDYSAFRGHSPVLPLGERIDALTDRLAFLCDQLQLAI